ncbi:hypothetical protein L838_4447 [Mycobacterium avium MAV_120709_2344]|nr:hypothetical protein L838_4447 [Mycobacterium avium MAV_120709_2344]
MVAEDFGKMLDLVVQAKSVAALASTLFPPTSRRWPSPVGRGPGCRLYNELDEITAADGDTDEVEVTRARPLV